MKARGHSYPLAGPSTEQSIMMHYLDLAIIKPDSGLNGKFEQLLVMAIIIITTMVTLPGSTLCCLATIYNLNVWKCEQEVGGGEELS